MKKISKVFKLLMINTIVFSLIQNPFVNEAIAAEKEKKNTTMQNAMTLANGALGIYGKYLGDKQQMIQQQMMAATNQRLMAQMSPSCRKPDGTACYTTPAKLFPECTLPASISNMPQNVCTNATPEVNQISNMMTYEAIATGWVNYYDQMSNKASNSAYAVGLSCLNGKQKALDSQLIEMSNSLQRLQDRLNQDKQVFRDNNKKLLEEMNAANDELFGEGGKSANNLNMKTQDFAKYFSQNCQSVLKEGLKDGKKSGFSGILQGLSSTNKDASDFNLNKASIENDLRRTANELSSKVKASGVDDFLSKTDQEVAGQYGAKVLKDKAEFKIAKDRITKTLSDVGYKIPSLDSQFTADADDLIASANNSFKKKFIGECVTGADKGIAIPVEDILRSIEQKRTNNAGTAANDYRAALKKILDSDVMMDQKMEMMKALEAQYPGITITYKDASQARVTESPYNLFMKTIEKCEQKFNLNDEISSSGSTVVSQKKQVERAKAALQELKTLNDSFASKVSQSFLAQTLDCDGVAPKAGDCSADKLKMSTPGFCISHANQCANEIQGCYGEVNNHVQTRKAKMENLAKKFNANVQAMVVRSNALYEQQKAAVTSITQLIQSKFPGTNFELPKDMFVSMPELKKDAFGVEMAGDGDLKSFLDGKDSMPDKIDKLKEMFKKQRETVNKEIGDYIALQEAAMSTQKGRWKEIADRCGGMITSSSQALADQNKEGMKNQQEMDKKVAKFCKKYDSISENPVGGCGKAKDLAELSDEISTRLTGQAVSLAEQYASACDGFNNSNDDLTDECNLLSPNDQSPAQKLNCARKAAKANASSAASAPTMYLSDLCNSKDASDESFISAVAKKLSEEDQKNLSGVKTLAELKAKRSSVKISDNGFFTGLEDVLGGDVLNDGEKICGKVQKDSKKEIRTLTEEMFNSGTTAEKIASNEKKIKMLKESDKEKSETIEKMLTRLASVSATADPTAESTKIKLIQNIGEQMDDQCDMLSNTSMAKNNGFDFLKSFDQGILGTARQQ